MIDVYLQKRFYIIVANTSIFVIKVATDHLQEMKKHEAVEKTVGERIKNDWLDKETIDNKYQEHLPEFLNLLEQFVDVWDEQLGHITTTKNQTERTDKHVRPVFSEGYRPRPTAG